MVYKSNTFSKKQYLLLIQAFKDQGYKISKYRNVDWANRPILFLRHDIDIDIYSSLDLARYENENGIESTYFFMISNSFYNALSFEGREIINKVHELGHDIALHIDLQLYKDSINIQNEIKKEIETLYKYFPYINLKVYSIHRPNLVNSMPKNKLDKSYQNVCNKFLFGHYVDYISDSTGIWRFGQPLNTYSFENKIDIQLLTHPIWWIKKGITPIDILETSLRDGLEKSLEITRYQFPKIFEKNNITVKM